MKCELEIVEFKVNDVVTASPCTNPALPVPIGDAPDTCPVGHV